MVRHRPNVKLLLVVNREAWAVGTLARLYQAGAPQSWEVEIVSIAEMRAEPSRFARRLAGAHLVHWMLHKGFAEAGARTGVGRHVVTVHHLDKNENDLAYLRSAAAVLTDADMFVEHIRRCVSEAQPVAVVPPPVDEGFFLSGARRLSLNASGSRTPGPFRIGFFAAAEYESDRKGIDLLPAVASLLRERGVPAEFVVSGLGWERRLPELATCGVRCRRVLVPSYFDMAKAYASLDAYLCLSRVEGGPMPVFEALAAGVPVVSTAVGNVPVLLRSPDMFLETPTGDAVAAGQALERLWHTPQAGRAMCERARAAIGGPLSVAVYRRRLNALYAGALGGDVPAGTEADRPVSGALRRRWRAWDRTYWAKELWVAGRQGEALRLCVEAFWLDPLCPGLWRVPSRWRRATRGSRVSPHE